MSILISELVKKNNLSDYCVIKNECCFDCFARATTIVDGKKCIFVSDARYAEKKDPSVAMIITTEEIAATINFDVGLCICNNPRGFFFELLSLYEHGDGFIRKDTVIGKNCIISDKAFISPNNVTIGNNVRIEDFVIIRPNTTIGDNVIIQSGAKIAEQDFNVYSFNGITKQIYHSGEVVIGSNVLISSNVLIGQALYSYGKTIIGDNSFIGASTCIGHNSEVGMGCEICGNSMIGGYCKIGDNSRLFMTVTIANSINVGERVTVNMGSVVIRDISSGRTVFGNPAREILAPRK